jgi:hypothetical protein
MKTRYRFLAGFALAAAAIAAMGQVAIQTFPPDSVYGRIGVGTFGPGGAIPISTLLAKLGIGATSHSVVIGTGSTSGSFNSAPTGTAGQILIDQGSGIDPAFQPASGACTVTAAGVFSCSNLGGGTRVITSATDTVQTSDCFKTLEISFSSGVEMETLPSASGFSSGCPIWFVNAGSRGAGLNNFPSIPSFNQPILYPGLALLVQNIGGNWTPVVVPGRYRQPGVNVFVDNVNGCANTSLCSGLYADGLAAGVGAFASPNQAFGFLYGQVDNMNGAPTVFLTQGQNYAECDVLQGQLTGVNVGFIQGNGGNVNWSASGTGCGATPAALNIGDNAEWEIQNVTFALNTNGSFGVFIHQTGVVDVLTGVNILSSASATTAFASDHGGFINLSSGGVINVTGTVTTFLGLGQSTQVNMGPITVNFVGTVAMTDFVSINGAGSNVNTSSFAFTGTAPAGLTRDACNGPSEWSLNSRTFPGTAGTPAHGCQVF